MPRRYKKKTANYSHHDLVRTMEMVNNGAETIYNAAKTCGMPKETLQRCLKDNNYENKGKDKTQFCSMRRKIFLFMPCNTLSPVDFHSAVMI